MEALVLKDGTYQWVKVDLKRSTLEDDSFITSDGTYYRGTQVMKFKNDIRRSNTEYVFCQECKCILKKEDWDSHISKMRSKADCFKCRNISKTNEIVETVNKCKKNNDGSFTVSQKVTFIPKCSCCSWVRNCEESKEKHYCRYYRCDRYGVKNVNKESVFVKYPKLFEGNLITISKLIECGWKTTPASPKVFQYKKIPLFAIVNELGVVTEFKYNTRNVHERFIYSQYYDKFFMSDYCGTYVDVFNFRYHTTQNVFEKVTTIIKNLYV